MSKLHELPKPIARRVLAMVRARDFPWFVLVRDSAGQEFGVHFPTLTPALLGRLIVQHRERANRAIKRYMLTDSRSSAKTAATHIHFCNLFTARREQLLGRTLTFAELPYPVLPDGEVA